MKIAIVGTHGTGKSTLSYMIAAHYKKLGKKVKVIQEVARACPFPINHGMTKEAALWIYLEHSRQELEAEIGHDVIVCDRSVYDSFAYAKHFKLLISHEMDYLERSAIKHFKAYQSIFFVNPDMPLQSDGIRPNDIKFQKDVHDIFEDTLSDISHIKVNSSDIFQDTLWAQFCSLLPS